MSGNDFEKRTVVAHLLDDDVKRRLKQPVGREAAVWQPMIDAEYEAGYLVEPPPELGFDKMITLDDIEELLAVTAEGPKEGGGTYYGYYSVAGELVPASGGYAVAMAGTECKPGEKEKAALSFGLLFAALVMARTRRKRWWRFVRVLLKRRRICVGIWFNHVTNGYEVNITLPFQFTAQRECELFGLQHDQFAIFDLRETDEKGVIAIGGSGTTEWVDISSPSATPFGAPPATPPAIPPATPPAAR